VVAARLATVFVMLGVVPVRPAMTQQSLRRSEPAAGRVSAPPRELRLTFSERVEMALTAVELVGPDGKVVPLAAFRLAPAAPNSVIAMPRSALGPGEYTVLWEAGGPDGHRVLGRFTFTVVGSARERLPVPLGSERRDWLLARPASARPHSCG
jgi:methionine-rich copper-binding protein CopC